MVQRTEAVALLEPSRCDHPARADSGSDAVRLARHGEARLVGFDRTSPFDMLSLRPAFPMSSDFGRCGLPTGARIADRPFDDPAPPPTGAAVRTARPFKRRRDLPKQ